jgi:hypothetical protein
LSGWDEGYIDVFRRKGCHEEERLLDLSEIETKVLLMIGGNDDDSDGMESWSPVLEEF